MLLLFVNRNSIFSYWQIATYAIWQGVIHWLSLSLDTSASVVLEFQECCLKKADLASRELCCPFLLLCFAKSDMLAGVLAAILDHKETLRKEGTCCGWLVEEKGRSLSPWSGCTILGQPLSRFYMI